MRLAGLAPLRMPRPKPIRGQKWSIEMSTAPSWKTDRLQLLERQVQGRRQNQMASFQPYPKQIEFFELGATKRERLLVAGNQLGKSVAGAYELSCHLTGIYASWWGGRRFDRPIRAWACGETSEAARDICQLKLCGQPGSEEDFGRGMLPKASLLGKSASHGIADAIDTLRVRHSSGGVSTLTFKSYQQGRAKFQGSTLDTIWLDEEPPADIYSECLARLVGDGVAFVTFTPLQGWSTVVTRFLREESNDRASVRMGMRDVTHWSEEEKQRRLLGYPEWERQARSEGVPMLGEGGVFAGIDLDGLLVPITLAQIPRHWALLWAIDFGINHPFAAVLLGHDRDTDCVTVLHEIRMRNALPLQHADAMKRIAPDVRVAYPRDGDSREKASGVPLVRSYRDQGLRMLPEHAQFSDGSISTETGVMQIIER